MGGMRLRCGPDLCLGWFSLHFRLSKPVLRATVPQCHGPDRSCLPLEFNRGGGKPLSHLHPKWESRMVVGLGE